MACGENGCNGNIVTNKLLDSNGLTYIKNLFNGKLFSIWGSLTVKGEKPINAEKSFGTAGETIVTVSADEAYKDDSGEYHSGVMSAEDKEKLDGISVSGVTEGNGLSVDENGNISMGAASETEAGAMSAEDKKKLDSLSTDVATEETDGLMSKEDKTFLDGLSETIGDDVQVVLTDEEGMVVGFSNANVLFAGSEMGKTLKVTAYKGGKKVKIVAEKLALTRSGSKGIEIEASITDDGELNFVLTREYALNRIDYLVRWSFGLEGESSSGTAYPHWFTINVANDSQCYDVLKGQVYTEEDKAVGTLWTFDGAEAAIRYVRTGTYWVNLPQSWGETLGAFDMRRLLVQVTMAGENVAAHVYCGRFDPGEEYNGDTASTDCWGAILVLTRGKDEEIVDGSFYINVAYMPSVETYEAEKEDATYKLRVEDFYYTAEGVSEKNTIGYEGGTLVPVLTLKMDKYVDDILISSDDVEPEGVTYTRGGGPDDVTFDTATGYITWTRNVHGYNRIIDAFVTAKAYTPAGELLEVDANIMNIAQEASPDYITVADFSYQTIPAEGATVTPDVEVDFIWKNDTGAMRVVVTGDCTYKYSVGGAYSDIATMVDETTGEMEVKANDTEKARSFMVNVEATYTRDDVTYTETGIIQVIQSRGGDIDPDEEAEEAEEALQLSVDSGYKMLATGSNTREASTGTSNPILSAEYVLPAGCSLKLSAKESTFGLRCQEGSDSQFDEPLEKSTANVAVGVYIGGSDAPTYSLGGGSVSGSGTAGEDTYNTCNLSNSITVPASDVDRVVQLGIAVTAMELRYMCNIYLTTDIHLSAEVTVD